ncbi:MAG TPA: SPFH domain-containing protein [Pseudomonadales bacterium]|nr:SPFH domain-containing protein [Pseudomonadales bacterium]
MNGHEHHDHDHEHKPDAPETHDAGSQALAEALGSSFTIVKIVMGLMVIGFIIKCAFNVQPQERAIILRFGKPVGAGEKALLGPGLHWALPYPIDEVVRIPISQIQTVTSDNGWYFTTPEQELSGEELPPGMSLNPAIDGYVLTADHGIAHVRATLSYHITDPIQYVFNFVNASNAVQNELDNAVLYSAAQFNADDILINDVERYREAVQERMTDLIDKDNLGIAIDTCTIDKTPPRQLTDIFNQVTDARQNRAKVLYDAHNYENQMTNNAGAVAANVVNLAQSTKFNYVANLNAEAKRFSDILPYYKTNSSLYVQQTFVRMIGPALTNVQDKWFLPVHADGKPYEVRLLLNRVPPQPVEKPAGQ